MDEARGSLNQVDPRDLEGEGVDGEKGGIAPGEQGFFEHHVWGLAREGEEWTELALRPLPALMVALPSRVTFITPPVTVS